MSKSSLFNPLEKAAITLKNRIVLAPLTRSRATADHIPTDIMATYYGQRAGAGLLITEGTSPSANGVGYPRIPGIYNEQQIEGWKAVTKAVHEKDAKIFIQMMHTGRVSHPANMPEGATILAPSAIAPATTKMYTDQHGEQDIPTPKAMTKEELAATKEEFVQAAKNAVEAGFDGVELHAANGYLLEQFINPHGNQRTDEYGGSIENRIRFVLEVADAVIAAIGKEKVGIRLSPNGAMNDITSFDEAEQEKTFQLLTDELAKRELVYIHLVNHASMGAPALPDSILDYVRANYNGLLILSGGYDKDSANEALDANRGDLVAFGRPFIANPDLPTRFQENAELNEVDFSKAYTPGPEGYIDYPALENANA